MNKAPSLGQTPPAWSRGRQFQQFPGRFPPKSASPSPPSSSDGNEQQSSASGFPENDSSTTISRDLSQHRMVVAVDYGTTFSGVAYAIHDNSYPELSTIRTVTNWGDEMSNEVKVPSVISYSPSTHKREQQFGASLSPDAVAMVNTKLELELQDTRLDELDLIIQLLAGTKNLNFEQVKLAQNNPGYTWKGPEDIVTDYLTKVFEHFEKATAYVAEIKSNVPVDIIITVPVRWSYKAKNSTFRAIRNAGFNENNFPHLEGYYLITEPAAAALFTARYLKQEEADSMKKGECFVLCDAGGGTVDVVSYKVKQIEPTFELEEITIPTNAKCGSSFINGKFKKWLHDVLGEESYHVLDDHGDGERISANSSEGGKMRHVMRQFESHKRAFHGASPDMSVDLPDPLHKHNIDGTIEEGELTITNDDMRFFFEDCIDEVIDLIQGQITQIDNKKNSRVKSILLNGGFSESKFLQEELAFSLGIRSIRLRRAEISWSAVFQGAALYGMEIANRKNHTKMMPCPRSYGLIVNDIFSKRMHEAKDTYKDPFTNKTMAKDRFDWIVMKGDLLQAEECREIERSLEFNFSANQEKKFSVYLYEYLDDDLPDRYQNAQEEVNRVGELTASLSLEHFTTCKNEETGLSYYSLKPTCKFIVQGTMLKGELRWNDQLMDELVLEIGGGPGGQVQD